MSDTFFLEGVERYIILFGPSRERDGFVRVREVKAEVRRTEGSVKKCFAVRETLVSSLMDFL
jgi:hypothetical protein